MNATELAEKMIAWGKARQALDALEAEIKTEVLELGETQKVGSVRASYSGGRKTYDYENAGKSADQAWIDVCTTPKTDWARVCKLAEIPDIPFTQTEPTVTIKLEEPK